MKKRSAIFCLFFLVVLFLPSCSPVTISPKEEKTPSPAPSVSEDKPVSSGWESSGGSGVACFDTEIQSLSVKERQKQGIALTQEQREQVRTLVALESWENYPPLKPGYTGNTVDEIIKDVRESLFKKYSPIFASRIELIEKRIPLSTWVPNLELEVVEDRTSKIPVEEKDKRCTIVQLVVRKTRSHNGKLPEVRMEYDRWLFENRLGNFDKAMIILHEYLYLIGKETGHHSSDSLRTEVAQILSLDLKTKIESKGSPAKSARSFQSFLGSIFGDYYRFFTDDTSDRPDVNPEGHTQYSRFKSFGTLLKLLRDRKSSCLDKEHFDKAHAADKSKIDQKCSFFAVYPKAIYSFLKDEEAFVYLARWLLDPIEAIDNSEILVDWDRKNPAYISAYQKTELARACSHLEHTPYPNFTEVIQKALSYCKRIEPS